MNERQKPELEVVPVILIEGRGFILRTDKGERVNWSGELAKEGERVSRFVSASDAIYFAGLHDWTVRKGVAG